MERLLTPEQVEAYHRDGLLVVRGVLSPEEVELARAYQGLAMLKEQSGNQQEANKLRGRAVDIFSRLRGAAATE